MGNALVAGLNNYVTTRQLHIVYTIKLDSRTSVLLTDQTRASIQSLDQLLIFSYSPTHQSFIMSANDTTNQRQPCTVCNRSLISRDTLKKHMLRWHPAEWMNQEQVGQITYFPCGVPGCNRLNNNTRRDFRVDHLSTAHGIDIPSKIRTNELVYLKRKTEAVLRMHIAQEAEELNELNAKIRHLECLLNLDARVVGYKSRHGFDTRTIFETNQALLPPKKMDLVSYLQRIRNTRNQAGSLYTKPGVMDIRDGVLDDLEMLMDWP